MSLKKRNNDDSMPWSLVQSVHVTDGNSWDNSCRDSSGPSHNYFWIHWLIWVIEMTSDAHNVGPTMPKSNKRNNSHFDSVSSYPCIVKWAFPAYSCIERASGCLSLWEKGRGQPYMHAWSSHTSAIPYCPLVVNLHNKGQMYIFVYLL